MEFSELQDKIGSLISEYNRGLEECSVDRVTTAQLYLAGTGESLNTVYVTPPEFSGMSASASKSLTTAASASSSVIECCAVGWMGVVWNGVFVNCFPVAGACGTYPGPNRCNIPGGD
ncbi:MAG: hypothetical protein AAF557_05605 [Pseudomonadota bacterium]